MQKVRPIWHVALQRLPVANTMSQEGTAAWPGTLDTPAVEVSLGQATAGRDLTRSQAPCSWRGTSTCASCSTPQEAPWRAKRPVTMHPTTASKTSLRAQRYLVLDVEMLPFEDYAQLHQIITFIGRQSFGRSSTHPSERLRSASRKPAL
jgi:hypothetical protein